MFQRQCGDAFVSHAGTIRDYLTDCFMYLDALMSFKLFKPENGETKLSLAARAGLQAKKCVGALRYLWRSSSGGAHDPRVGDLKQLLMPSPPRNRRVKRQAATRQGFG